MSRYGEPRDTCANSTVSAHLYSRDGLAWRLGAEQPYTTTVLLADNTTAILSTRYGPVLTGA